MRSLRQIFKIKPRDSPRVAPDLFDIYHAKTVTALRDERDQPLGEWSAADAESLTSALRFILGLLRSRPRLRSRFPDALRGSAFQAWLLNAGAREFGLKASALENIAAAFAADLAAPVLDFYLHRPEIQWRYPLGLLPVGQKRFVRWMLGKGRAQHPFSDEQILWFLHFTAEDLPRHIALTYLINPAWQEKFPRAGFNSEKLLAWLRGQFPKYRRLRKVRSLPLDRQSETGAGINILSHFCYPSGLQQAALATKDALEGAGFETSCRDVPAGVPTELQSRLDWLGLEIHPVTLTNVAPQPHFQSRYLRAGLAPRLGIFNIGYWYWELEVVPNEWKEFAHSLDEIWAPTPFVAKAMRATMPVPVYGIMPAVSIGPVKTIPRARLSLAENEFVFLFMFDMCSDFRRKNPLALVDAFRRAFGASDRATLVLKVSRGRSDAENLERLKTAAAGSKIVVLDELVSRAEAYGYVEMCDCAVSLHRSEGFGLLLAEAMLLGKPAIATNYSGNTAFMTPENSLLVDYDLVSIADDGAIYKKGNRWAEASADHAAQLMRRLYENRAEATALGARAKADVTELLSLKAAGERMKARLEAITCSRA